MYAIVQNLQQQLQEQAVRLTQLNEQLQQEIAQRQQIEASLQESKARFQATFEQVAVGMAHVGIEGQFLRVNQKLCEMYGYTREELLKQTFQAITHPDYVDADLNYTRQLLAGEIKTYSMEKCYIRKNGTLLWANLTVSLAQAVSRESQYFVVVVTDINNAHDELRLCQQAEATLQFQGKFDRLVASISTRFINLPSQAISEEINQALQDMGKFMQVDTSYVCRISSDRQAFSMTYEWIVPELAPQIQNLQNVPKWIFPWAFAKLQQGEILYVPSVANLPEEAAIERTHWQGFNLKSVICIPLVYQNTALGWVGFGSYRESKIWSDTDINLLKKFSAILTSVLQRQQTEDALWESEQRYNLVIRGSGDGLWDWDIAANQTYLSPRWKQILGYEDHELGTDSDVFLSRLHPDESNWVKQAIRDHLEQQTPFNIEFRLRHKTGEYIWVHSRGQALWDEAGNPLRMAGSISDISDRKAVEEALRESEQKFRQLAENIHEVLFVYPPDYSQLIYINPAYEQIWGYSCESLYQNPQSWLDAIHPADCTLVYEALQKQFAGERFYQEYRIIRPDGEIRWIFARTFILFNEEGKAYRVVGVAEDITERKQAELTLQQFNQELEERVKARTQELEQFQAILQQREQEIRTLVENYPDIIARFDGELRHLYVNSAITQTFGLSADECLRKTLFELPMFSVCAEQCTNAMHQVFQEGKETQVEIEVPTLKGWRWYQTRFVPEFNSQGQVVTVLKISHDITDNKQAENALRQSEQKFRQLAETIHEVFFLESADAQQIFYISPAYETIWGRSCQSLYEKPQSWIEAIHPEDRDRILSLLVQFIQHSQTQAEFDEEFRIVRPDGTVRWVSDRATFVLNEAGQPYRIAGIAQDITERKLAEQELEKSRQFIQRIADASPNILYIYDLVEQRNVYVNREIAEILGYTPTEIHAMGSSVLPTLMHPDDFAKVPKNLERIYAAADGEILKWEYRMRCANGEWRWIYSHETVFTRTAEGAVQQIIGTAEDISDRKRAEEQIRASLAEKEVLLREIHHRVKNNLNVIHSLLNMQVRTIQDPVTKNLLLDSQKRLQTMALIHEQLYQSQSLAEINFAEYIHRLANNLFAAANLNHDLIKLQIQAEPVDLNLETAIPCGLIINELLTNSFKHAFPEGHSGVIRIEFYRDRDETLHLIISDNGVGMPPESNLYKKASLGMRLVKILVQQLRATLEISGHQGASFHLSFIQIN